MECSRNSSTNLFFLAGKKKLMSLGQFLATHALLHLAEHFDILTSHDNARRVIIDNDDKLKWKLGAGLWFLPATATDDRPEIRSVKFIRGHVEFSCQLARTNWRKIVS
jgi:hypothetical protein